MFCTNCGRKTLERSTFCIECGQPTSQEDSVKTSPDLNLNQRWWFRFAKVIYIALYIPLPFLLALVWSENSSSYIYYSNSYQDTMGTAFWYSLLTLVIYMVIARLMKITFLYISFAQKPQWKKEFKKLF